MDNSNLKTNDEAVSQPTDDNQRVLKKQWIVVGGIALGLCLLCTIFFFFKSSPPVKPKPVTVGYDQSSTDGAPQQEWVYRGEQKIKMQQDQLTKITEELVVNKKQQAELQATLSTQRDEVAKLTAQLSAMMDANVTDSISGEPDRVIAALPAKPRPTLITRKWTRPKKPVAKTPETFVPATSFVKGVLLNGVDAQTGVTSQGDPKPVTLRLVDSGSLPNGKRSHLKGCRVLGVAHGEISSERALIRLSKLSCWQLGEYREFPIKGYVTGHDGKPGIRGRVVMRDGAAVSRAFVGGFVGGLAKSASNSLTFQSVSPEGSVSSVKSGDAFRYAGADGVSDGLSMYAKYQIKRAEQYQPVIEVGSGIAVDVVFTEGFYLDGFKLSASGSRENAEADFDASPGNNAAEPKPFLQLPTRGDPS